MSTLLRALDTDPKISLGRCDGGSHFTLRMTALCEQLPFDGYRCSGARCWYILV